MKPAPISRSTGDVPQVAPSALSAHLTIWQRLQRLRHRTSTQPAPVLPVKRKRSQRSLRRYLRYFYYRFIRLRSSPEAIARGLAAGVFAGCFPLFGLQTIIGVALAAAVRGSKIMAAAGTWISNPLTYVPIYAFNLWVGQQLLGTEFEAIIQGNFQSWADFVELGAEFTTTLFVGCAIVGSICSLLSYFVGLKLVRIIRQRHRAD